MMDTNSKPVSNSCAAKRTRCQPVDKQRNNNGRRLGGVTGKGFLPGRSGNLKGRPKGSSITARLLKILENDDGKVAEAIAQVIIREALKGRFRFIKEILDRVDGKVPYRIASFDGGPVLVQKVVDFDLDQL